MRPTKQDWKQRIERELRVARRVRRAVLYHGQWSSYSRPIRVTVEPASGIQSMPGPQEQYVVKARRDGFREVELPRVMIAEQVVGTLGIALGAPVPPIDLIYIPDSFRRQDTALTDIVPGYAHGSQQIPDCTERKGIEHVDVPENRPRFAHLAVLYGWCGASDHQFIYEQQSPRLVWSVDHGHFLGGPERPTFPDLSSLPPAQPDATILQQVRLRDDEVRSALSRLSQVTVDDVSRAVSIPPDGWGLTLDERIDLAEVLWQRRHDLLRSVP